MNIAQQIKESGYACIEDIGLDDPNGALKDVVSSVATPISYLDLPLVMDLQPQPGYQPASFAGTGVFDLHTDLSWFEKPPKYIAMFCVSPESAGGGIPLLADGWKALADLDEADATYLKTEPVTFHPPSHIDYTPLSGPIISEKQDDTIMVRFRYDMLDNPAPAVTHYRQATNDNVIFIDAKPGMIFIFDNDRMLHGRTELQGGMTSDRHFKRMYGDV